MKHHKEIVNGDDCNSHRVRSSTNTSVDDDVETYDDPADFNNLTEIRGEEVVENANEQQSHTRHSLEEELSRRNQSNSEQHDARPSAQSKKHKRGRFPTIAITSSYLIFFSILGTLARLGLEALTYYPGNALTWKSIWPNFTGSLILGFLSEGADLFHHPRSARSISRAERNESLSDDLTSIAMEKAHECPRHQSKSDKQMNPMPLHIGLAIGFCGSLTTFSSFMEDSFLVLSGTLNSNVSETGGGQKLMFLLALGITTISLSVGGLKAGAHMAIFASKFDRKIPNRLLTAFDTLSIIFGIGSWLGVIFLAIFPPDRPGGPLDRGVTGATETWRGTVIFALVFAPVGALARFLISIKLNLKFASFPLGTFASNMLGTLVLATAWDLQRIHPGKLGGWIGGNLSSCQVLQGIIDGFCGCMTTVSTWILELVGLRRKHAYQYGIITLATGLAIVVAVMGTSYWTDNVASSGCLA